MLHLPIHKYRICLFTVYLMSSLFCSFPYKSPACLLKFILVCIFICWAILNMYCRFYMLIANKKKKKQTCGSSLYPTALLNPLVLGFLWILWHFLCRLLCHLKTGQFYFFLSDPYAFSNSSSYLIDLARNSSTMFNYNGDNKHHCFVLTSR